MITFENESSDICVSVQVYYGTAERTQLLGWNGPTPVRPGPVVHRSPSDQRNTACYTLKHEPHDSAGFIYNIYRRASVCASVPSIVAFNNGSV